MGACDAGVGPMEVRAHRMSEAAGNSGGYAQSTNVLPRLLRGPLTGRTSPTWGLSSPSDVRLGVPHF